MRPIHAVVALVVAVAWAGVLAFVLTHGKDQGSGVDVYSELPAGFTAAMQTKGVTYSGLSPVDNATVQQVLAHATAAGPAASGASPIVLRTAFSDSGQGTSFQDRPALMVVVPQSGRSVHVAFLDPTTYTTLATVTYDDAGASG